MLATMALTSRVPKVAVKTNYISIIIVFVTGLLLVYGTLDMPNFGSNSSPAQLHLSSQYLLNSPTEVGIPNVVTAILASYRGFDTLGETAVVFTAGVGVILLLGGLRRRRKAGNGDK
jgi:multicomponent Na+:H+ antiporter subunit B